MSHHSFTEIRPRRSPNKNNMFTRAYAADTLWWKCSLASVVYFFGKATVFNRKYMIITSIHFRWLRVSDQLSSIIICLWSMTSGSALNHFSGRKEERRSAVFATSECLLCEIQISTRRWRKARDARLRWINVNWKRILLAMARMGIDSWKTPAGVRSEECIAFAWVTVSLSYPILERFRHVLLWNATLSRERKRTSSALSCAITFEKRWHK